jgi:hypothetical protein
MEAIMKTTLLTILIAIAALIVVGCGDDDDEIVYIISEDGPPPVPQGVYSVTGDEEVLLYWLPIDDVNNDFLTYVVYRSDHHPDTGYWEIGQTTSEYFIDGNVNNGHTYFYAVSSLDMDGYISDLSYEMVFDTPRPEGTGAAMFDYNTLPDYAGWDLSAAMAVNYLSGNCDLFLEYFDGDDVFYFNVSNIDTDIQDMGFTNNMDEITYSPEYGWSQNGWLEVILGHTYVIWTDNNHFAKIRVTALGNESIIFDWAYQVDPGNLELKPKVEREDEYLRHPRDGS